MFRADQKIGSYRLIKRLGRGGFGEVWLAERTTKFVTTSVALKLPIDDEIDHALVMQEAQVWARASGHPNVLSIIDADEYDGQVVIVSEYAPDGSLWELLKSNNGQLPTEQAIEIAIGILAGLEFLHSKGIIHRDIKPANVLLQGRTPRLTDFGISREMKTGSASQNIAGTPLYMAPEAFYGKRNAGTDIWGTGVLLYQMLAGRVPYPSQDVSDLAAIVMGKLEPLPPEVPDTLQRIVRKALAKEPLHRYQTASQMKEDLYVFLRRDPSLSGSDANRTIASLTTQIVSDSFDQAEKKSIAILPFRNLNGDAASQFYEFSLADAVTTELARLRPLVVRPSSVIAKYQNKEVDPREAGKEMGVNSVLSAAFIHAGTRFRVTAQLLEVSSGEILWSDRIDSDADDIFLVQDTITQRIVEGLRLDLSADEQEQFGQRLTDNIEAYEEYLRGRDKFARFIFRTLLPADCDAAIKSFERAVELDPKFALAWSGLGSCYANRVFKALGDMDDYNRAEAALERALALDPNVVRARVVMCFINGARGKRAKVREETERLYKQFPNDAAVYFLKGVMHRISGDYETSLKCFDRLERLDPASTISVTSNRARIFSMQGDHERALKEIDRGASVEPSHPFVEIFRAQVLFYKGDVEEATTRLSAALAEHPHLDGVRPLLAIFHAAQGQREAALENLSERIRGRASADYDACYWIASAYAQLGEKDVAIEWLERAISMGMEDRRWFETDINLKNLRPDPRFEAIMNRINVGSSSS